MGKENEASGDSSQRCDAKNPIQDIDLEALSQQLREWPFTFTAIEETLGTDLIESKGRQLLYRSLNAGTLNAFVGSGVPMAYGRLSWAGWKHLQLGAIETCAETFVECSKAYRTWAEIYLNICEEMAKAHKQPHSAVGQELAARKATLSALRSMLEVTTSQVEDLLKTFKHLRKGGHSIGGEVHPVAFQVGEQLHDLLRANRESLYPRESVKFIWDCVLEKYLKRERRKLSDEHLGSSAKDRFVLKPNMRQPTSTIPKNLKGQLAPDGIDYPGSSLDIQELHEASRDFAQKLEWFSEIASRPIARERFSTSAKMLLVDEVAHSEEILRESLSYGQENGRDPKRTVLLMPSDKNDKTLITRHSQYVELEKRRRAFEKVQLRRDFLSLRDERGRVRYTVLGHYKLGALKEFQKAELLRNTNAVSQTDAQGLWKKLDEIAAQEVEKAIEFAANGENSFLPAVRRFLVGTYIARVEDPLVSLCQELKTGEAQIAEEYTSPLKFFKKVELEDYTSRFSLTAKAVDPLWKLSVDLGIKRYLTTNYDFEIERLFEDRAYSDFGKEHFPGRPKPEADQMRHDGLGGTVVDFDFTREKAPDLTAFAAASDDADAGVFHLHGRATQESQLVITERDYMNRYLKEDEYRETVDEAIRTAFSANPLLFIGLGLSEADVMRPLRQFMSNRAPARQRRAVALLAGSSDRETRAKEAATIYLRYGVHIVYYGDATVRIRSGEGKDPENPSEVHFDWLHRVSKLMSVLKKRTEHRLKALQAVAESWTDKNGETQDDPDPVKLLSAIETLIGFDLEETPPLVSGNRELVRLFPQVKREAEIAFRALSDEVGVYEPPKKSNSSQGKQVESWNALALLVGLEREGKKGELVFTETDLEDIDELAPVAFAGDPRRASGKAENAMPVREDGLTLERRMLAAFLRSELKPYSIRQKKRNSLAHLLHKREALLASWAVLSNIKKEIQDPESPSGDKNVAKEKKEKNKEELNGKIEEILDLKGPRKGDIRAVVKIAIRDQHARSIALDGLKNAVYSGALAASLDRIRDDWLDWRSHWTMGPPHRRPRYYRLPQPPRSANAKEPGKVVKCGDGATKEDWRFPVRLVRHRLSVTITDFPTHQNLDPAEELPITTFEEANGEDRGPSGPTRIRSFDTFLEALQDRSRQDLASDRLSYGRRFHLVAADRGSGKGVFTSAFTWRTGLLGYIQASWPLPEKPGDGETRPAYGVAIFVNLSFSTEISSNYDALADCLRDWAVSLDVCASGHEKEIEVLRKTFDQIFHMTDHQNPILSSQEEERMRETLRQERTRLEAEIENLPRIAKLSYLFNRIRENAEKFAGESAHAPRLLLVFNGAELFFHPPTRGHPGYTKNREIYEFLSLLMSRNLSGVPFDIVLIANDSYLGAPLTLQASNSDSTASNRYPDFSWTSLLRAETPPAALSEIRRREATGPLPIAWDRNTQNKLDGDLDLMRTLKAEQPLDEFTSTNRFGTVHILRPMSTFNFLIDNFQILSMLLYFKYLIERKSPRLDKAARSVESKTATDLRGELFNEWSKSAVTNIDRISPREEEKGKLLSIDTLVTYRSRSLNAELKHALLEIILKTIFNGPLPNDDNKNRQKANIILRERYSKTGDEASFRDWRQIRERLRGNRFSLTILLAAAERIALQEEDALEAARKAEVFISSTNDAIANAGQNLREQVVVSRVLDVYETFHEKGNPELDQDLHYLLMRHLAVIGIPVGIDVLVRAPAIRRYLDKDGVRKARPRSRMVLEALTSMTLRGLIFRVWPDPRLGELKEQLDQRKDESVDPKPSGIESYPKLKERLLGRDEREPSNEYRYVLHRVTQLHILRKMGAQAREFGELNSFSPSLFASMSADLPRPDHEAYEFLRKLVASLSQYPDTPLGEEETKEWVFANAPIATRVHALRAALSILRSTFSVAVVSRFSDYARREDKHAGKPPRGFFEEYRIQLRWIIRKAWELLTVDRKIPIDRGSYDPDRSSEYWQVNACYRDEVVWLYNECGVVCLVQGNLRESSELFNQAIELNRTIEKNEDGPIHGRLSLVARRSGWDKRDNLDERSGAAAI